MLSAGTTKAKGTVRHLQERLAQLYPAGFDGVLCDPPPLPNEQLQLEGSPAPPVGIEGHSRYFSTAQTSVKKNITIRIIV